jgi:hypothetical protein
MRKLKIRSRQKSLLTLTRSRQWSDRMVYVPAANQHLPYKNGRSRILYIGTTKKGAGRTATSAVNKASEVFYKLHGVSTIDVHIVTCAKRKNVQTWKRLESALIDASRKRYFELPHYNRVRPKPTEGLLGANALQKTVARFEPG